MGKKPREGIKITITIVQLQKYLSKRCKSSQSSKYHLPSHTYTAPSDLDRQRLESHKPSLDTFGIPPKVFPRNHFQIVEIFLEMIMQLYDRSIALKLQGNHSKDQRISLFSSKKSVAICYERYPKNPTTLVFIIAESDIFASCFARAKYPAKTNRMFCYCFARAKHLANSTRLLCNPS